MRVAQLSTDPGIAFGGTKGAAVHVEELAVALRLEEAEVLVLVASVEGATPAGVETIGGPRKGATAEERLAGEPELADRLETRLREFGAEVLYERIALYSSAGSTAARRLGIPHLVELNAPLPFEASRYRRLEHAVGADRHELRVLTGADVVLAVSAPLAEYAQMRGARRVVVLPNAVDPTKHALAKRTARPPVAVFAGSLRPWHGVDCIAHAWALLGDHAPPLLVVGDGPGRELLERVGAHVTGAVAHSDVPSFLAQADIALAPYASDAPDYFSPLKLFEYLAAGLATIAGDLPGIRDVVGPETAILIPAGDAEALAGAVASLATDCVRRELLGDAGRALVEREHTWRHRARRIHELARDLTRTRAAAA